jgi:type I restriction enzyme S subunit
LYLTCKNFKDGKLDLSKASYIIESDYSKHFKSESNALTKPTAGDVLFSIIGTIGEPYLYKDEDFFGISSSVSILRPNNSLSLHSSYLYYWIKNREFQKAVIGMKGGVAQGYLSLDMIRALPIRYPSLPSQEKIAFILSAYDDLIENNRRRIQLLEQAARLLYREWFVYFRFPGHEHVTITDGVPEGWSKSVVADFYFTGSGGTPSRKNPDFYTGKIPWVKTQELTGGFILSTVELITDEAVKCSSAKLFPRHTVLIAMYGATIGQNAILSVPSTTNQACCAVIPKKPGTSYAHAYLFFCHHKTDLVGLGQGAAQNNISQQVIKSFKMVLPRKELMDAFLESVSPLFEQVEILQKSNINLIQARDLLLPRLMNEEVTP